MTPHPRHAMAPAEGAALLRRDEVALSRPRPVVADRTAARRPLRVGLLSGLGYRNQRGGLTQVSRYVDTLKDVPHRIARTPDEVEQALLAFDREGIDVVAINGGDGTVSMVLTSLLRRPHGALPLLAILAGGRTNMTAGDVGLAGNQVRRLESLLGWAAASGPPETIVERPILRVRLPDQDDLYGFFVGAAAIYTGSLLTRGFHAKSRVPGMGTGLGTTVSVVKLVLGHIFGRRAFPPARLRVVLDGEPLAEERWCLLFATTLERMALGLRPYWGDTPGRLHVTAIAHEHRRFLRVAPAAVFGRPNRHLVPENGYLSRNVTEMELKVEDGATLDGEMLVPGPDVKLRLDVPRTARFVRF